jgi:hypothetical protein
MSEEIATLDCWPEIERTLRAALAAMGMWSDLMGPTLDDLRRRIGASYSVSEAGPISPEHRDSILEAIERAGPRARQLAVKMFGDVLSMEMVGSGDLSAAGRSAAVARLAGRRFAVVDGGKGA